MKLLVDLEKLDSTAKKIDNAIVEQKKTFNRLKTKINSEFMDWDGKDAKLFKNKWENLMDDDSEFKKQQKMLQSYSNYLKKCRSEYSKVKENAISKAKKVPR